MVNKARASGGRPLLPKPRLLLPKPSVQSIAAASIQKTHVDQGQTEGKLSFLGLPAEIRDLIYTFLVHTSPQGGDSTQISNVRNGYVERYRYRMRPEAWHHQIRLCNRQICNEFQKLIDHLAQARQIHYRFHLVAFYSDYFRWKQFPTLLPNIESVTIDYCVCEGEGWEASLESSQGRRHGIFGRGICTRSSIT
jgi:hypothetical protein